MSSKTSFKRVALVAAAALAIGGISAVSANAAVLPNGTITSITASSVTTSPTINTAVYIKAGVSVAALVATGSADTVSLTAGLTSFPTGGSVSVASNVAGSAVPVGTATPIAVTASSATTTAAAGGVLTTTTTGTTAWSSQTVAYLGGFNFTPTKVGTYVLTIWNDTNGDSVINNNEVQQTVSITVGAATALAPALAIVRSAVTNTAVVANPETSDANYTSTTNGVALAASKTAGNAIGQVEVILLNSDNTAAGSKHTISATVTGSGLAVIDNSGTTNTTSGVRAASYTLTGTQNVAVVHLISDGTAGVGTVTISVTDSVSSATTVLGTKSFTSYGSVTKIVATPILSIGTAGGGTTGTSGVTPTLAAFTVTATDALGNPVTGLTITGKSSDATIVNSTVTITADDGSVGNGNGQYNGSFSTAATATSGKTATLTIRVVDPAGDGTTYLTSDLPITIGGSVAKEVITTDKASYAPGDAMIITITATDAAGNPVADGKASPTGISSNKSVLGLPTAASTYKAGVKVYKTGVYAPSVSGPFILTTTSTNTAGDTITATATVTGDTTLNAAIQAALDAANAAADAAAEATDAANAATDAANAAADAADSATAAAQDAADQAGQALAAVNTLATSVAVLVAGIKAQITSVTNLVIKLIKKVATLPKK
jgi:hypothetical protein